MAEEDAPNAKGLGIELHDGFLSAVFVDNSGKTFANTQTRFEFDSDAIPQIIEVC